MGFHNYSTITLQLELSYMTCGALGWKYRLVGFGEGYPSVF
jgi:hypothetical protein